MKQKKEILIDGIDKKILRALMKDARTPILEIARNVGISGAAIHQRLRKLEKNNLLAGSKFLINPEALGNTNFRNGGALSNVSCVIFTFCRHNVFGCS
jgi:Lrp/AsnC family transcriptional regulator for asnA, asnC and gidA